MKAKLKDVILPTKPRWS